MRYSWMVRASKLTSPRTAGDNLVISKNLTPTSPVMTPSFSVSATLKSCPKSRRSSGVRCKLGCSTFTIPLAESCFYAVGVVVDRTDADLRHFRCPPLSPKSGGIPGPECTAIECLKIKRALIVLIYKSEITHQLVHKMRGWYEAELAAMHARCVIP